MRPAAQGPTVASRMPDRTADRQSARRSAAIFALVLIVSAMLGGLLAHTALADDYSQKFDPKTGMPLSNGGSQDPQTPAGEKTTPTHTSSQPGGETTTPTDSASQPGGETTGPSQDMYGSQDESSGLTGMVLGFTKKIMSWVYDSTIGDLIKKVAEALQAGILGLPSPSGQVVDMYEGMVTVMRPIILVGILVTALLMMLRTSNYDVAYASFSALPKFVGLGIAFAFLPEFMQDLSKITLDVSSAFMPSGDRAAAAGLEMFKAVVTNVAGGGILNVILAAMFTFVGFMVVLVALLKNILFQMLFIAGPFALAASVVPGISHLTASWFRGVLACAAVPILWSLELGIASVVVASPEVVFGDMVNVLGAWSDGIFTTVGAIVILWIMYKTPFKVLEWAFESYDSSRGAWRGIVRGVAIGATGMGIRSGAKALLGGSGGAAKGAEGTPGSGTTTSNTVKTGSGFGGKNSSSGMKGSSRISQIDDPNGSSSPPAGSLGASKSPPKPLPPGNGGAGEQKALPAASPAIERKFIKQEGTAPGFGKPHQNNNNALLRNKNGN